jgi:lysophospholipase L1-like esterase
MHLIFLIIILSEIIIAQEERAEHCYDRNHQFSQEFSSIPAGKIIFLGNSITEGFNLRNDLSVDGLHLNQSGYNIWKNVLHKSGLN